MSNTSNIVTRRELAERLGLKSPSYINELEKQGRVVKAPDGKHYLALESARLREATKDPAHQGVADRHASARAAGTNPRPEYERPPAPPGPPPKLSTAPASSPVPQPATTPTQDPSDDPTHYSGYNFQDAKAKHEYWAAEREHASFQKEAGELMERSAVTACFAEAGTILRSKLESWQATLPPQLAGREEAAIRTVLADQVESLLLDLVGTFNHLVQADK